MKNIVINKNINIKGKSPFRIIKIIGLVLIVAVLVFAFGSVIKLLWNSLMPEIFGLKEITYLQGVGLLLLSRILIGGFGSDKVTNNNHGGNGKTYKAGPVTLTEAADPVTETVDPDEENYEKWWTAEGERAFEAYNENKDE